MQKSDSSMVKELTAWVPYNSIIRKFIKGPEDIESVYGVKVLDFYVDQKNDIQFTVKGGWDRVNRFKNNSLIIEEENGHELD